MGGRRRTAAPGARRVAQPCSALSFGQNSQHRVEPRELKLLVGKGVYVANGKLAARFRHEAMKRYDLAECGAGQVLDSGKVQVEAALAIGLGEPPQFGACRRHGGTVELRRRETNHMLATLFLGNERSMSADWHGIFSLPGKNARIR